MYFPVLLVLMLVRVHDCHLGETQTWLATVSELLEKMIKTEIRVQTMQEEVNAGLKTISALTENMNTLQTTCSGLVNKTGRQSLGMYIILLQSRYSSFGLLWFVRDSMLTYIRVVYISFLWIHFLVESCLHTYFITMHGKYDVILGK